MTSLTSHFAFSSSHNNTSQWQTDASTIIRHTSAAAMMTAMNETTTADAPTSTTTAAISDPTMSIAMKAEAINTATITTGLTTTASAESRHITRGLGTTSMVALLGAPSHILRHHHRTVKTHEFMFTADKKSLAHSALDTTQNLVAMHPHETSRAHGEDLPLSPLPKSLKHRSPSRTQNRPPSRHLSRFRSLSPNTRLAT